MKKFVVANTEPKPFTLVFPHIPKTGGTTLLYHFRKNVGDDAIMSYGPFNRITRFFSNQFQIEEMNPVEIDKLRVVQGHGVSDQTVSMIRRGPVRLLVVLRHPISLTRSRYNHRKMVFAKRGKNLNSSEFIAEEPRNFMTNLLLQKFGAFADPNAQTTVDRVVSVLQKFDYVFTTEMLDQQMQGLAQDLVLHGSLERRRVAEEKEPLKLSDEEIEQHNPIDLKIFERANVRLHQNGRYNPFGGDAEGRTRVITNLQRTSKPKSPEHIYHELSEALCQNLRAEAALAKIINGSNVALRHPNRFQEILRQKWTVYAATLTSERSLISKNWLASWKANNLFAEV